VDGGGPWKITMEARRFKMEPGEGGGGSVDQWSETTLIKRRIPIRLKVKSWIRIRNKEEKTC
jgi:hypothetical protein